MYGVPKYRLEPVWITVKKEKFARGVLGYLFFFASMEFEKLGRKNEFCIESKGIEQPNHSQENKEE